MTLHGWRVTPESSLLRGGDCWSEGQGAACWRQSSSGKDSSLVPWWRGKQPPDAKVFIKESYPRERERESSSKTFSRAERLCFRWRASFEVVPGRQRATSISSRCWWHTKRARPAVLHVLPLSVKVKTPALWYTSTSYSKNENSTDFQVKNDFSLKPNSEMFCFRLFFKKWDWNSVLSNFY